LHQVVRYNFTDVPKVLAGSIIRAIITLIMEAVGMSETLINFYQCT
jgi:hypothetical protein